MTGTINTEILPETRICKTRRGTCYIVYEQRFEGLKGYDYTLDIEEVDRLNSAGSLVYRIEMAYNRTLKTYSVPVETYYLPSTTNKDMTQREVKRAFELTNKELDRLTKLENKLDRDILDIEYYKNLSSDLKYLL